MACESSWCDTPACCAPQISEAPPGGLAPHHRYRGGAGDPTDGGALRDMLHQATASPPYAASGPPEASPPLVDYGAVRARVDSLVAALVRREEAALAAWREQASGKDTCKGEGGGESRRMLGCRRRATHSR